MNSERFDMALSRQKGISREAAKSMITGGKALVNGKEVSKPSFRVSELDELTITENIKYVSRGGYKLEKALRYFDIDLAGKICADIGASTGGFTDCILQHGAKMIYAVDVGSGQLAERLKADERVISYEKTDIRKIEGLIKTVDFAFVDVSFISLCKIFDHINGLFSENAVCLVKPQFEAGRGVPVMVKKTHERVLREVIQAAKEYFRVAGLTFSPIRGSDGNIEYLLYLSKTLQNAGIDISGVVAEAFGKAESG